MIYFTSDTHFFYMNAGRKKIFDNYDSDRDGRITSILFDGIKRGVFDTAKFDSVPELQLAKNRRW